MPTLRDALVPLLDEIGAVAAAMPEGALAPLEKALLEARRIVLYGQGRTGLVLQALTMRLYHLGLDAHWTGAMTTPPVGPGDLLVVNASAGDMPTALALIGTARQVGAKVATITAVADSPAGRAADALLVIPAQTLAGAARPDLASGLPMGSQYELVLFLVAELLVLRLSEARGMDFDAMRARHTNLL